MTIAETFEHNGFKVDIIHDETRESPRTGQTNTGLFLGFKNRRYTIGDEEVDPNDWSLDCSCDEGEITMPILGEQVTVECTLCDGLGNISVRSFDDAVHYVRKEFDAIGPVLPVSIYDHGNVSYQVGFPSDPWDSGNAGLIFATRKSLDETQGEGETPSDEDLTKWLTGEIDEYSKWANGECFGFRITDRNGDEVDSCWGFIGEEYATEAAKEAVPNAEDMPARLRTCRFSDTTLDVIERALEAAATIDAIPLPTPGDMGYANALEVVRGAHAGGDPEGNQMYHSVYRMTAPAGHPNEGKTFSFSLTPADLRKYKENDWTVA